MVCAICSLSTSACMGPLLFGDVAEHGDRPAKPAAFVAQRPGVGDDAGFCAGPFGLHHEFEIIDIFAAQRPRQRRIRDRQRRGAVRKETGEFSYPRQAVEAAVDTQQPPGRGVGNDDHRILVGHDNAIADAFDRVFQQVWPGAELARQFGECR